MYDSNVLLLHYTRSLPELDATRKANHDVTVTEKLLFKTIGKITKELYAGICFELEVLDSDLIFLRLKDIWARQRSFWQNCVLFFSALNLSDPNSILNIGHNRWLTDVILSSKLRLREKIMDLIQSASAIEKLSLKNITALLIDMGEPVYTDLFENQYLEYIAAKHHWLEQC